MFLFWNGGIPDAHVDLFRLAWLFSRSVHGETDRMVPFASARRTFREMPVKDKQVGVYTRGRGALLYGQLELRHSVLGRLATRASRQPQGLVTLIIRRKA
jgi:hypothetical protein